jgi:hypothetical protein
MVQSLLTAAAGWGRLADHPEASAKVWVWEQGSGSAAAGPQRTRAPRGAQVGWRGCVEGEGGGKGCCNAVLGGQVEKSATLPEHWCPVGLHKPLPSPCSASATPHNWQHTYPPSDKIVSLAPGATEMLWELGLGNRWAA